MSDCLLSLGYILPVCISRLVPRNMPTVFLLTDAQVPDEGFLVLIDDLASGD
ncbi:DYH11 protein, partial [Bucorvus abyssinicus]|nr:DYH11 protein [Bucorvus abyssinicus]